MFRNLVALLVVFVAPYAVVAQTPKEIADGKKMMAGFAQTGSTGKAIGAKNKITDSKSNYSSMNTRYVAVYGSMSQKDIDYVESQASSYWENIDYADSYYDDGEDAWYIASALVTRHIRIKIMKLPAPIMTGL